MGRKSRQNLRKTGAAKERQDHQRATEKNLRLTLMNMRQLFEQATQVKLQLAAQLDELKIMIAAVAIGASEGTLMLTKENLDRARLMDGIQVDPLVDDEGGYMVSVVEAPQEEEKDDDSQPQTLTHEEWEALQGEKEEADDDPE